MSVPTDAGGCAPLAAAVGRSLLALALCGAFASAQAAAVVTVKFDSPVFNGSGNDVVRLTAPKQGSPTQTINVGSVGAGRMQGTVTNHVDVDASVFVDSLTDLYMYCYDVYERISGGQTVTYAIDFDGESARTLDFLGAVNAVINRGRPTEDPFAWLHPVSAWQGAAIQLGIWESLYDGSGWDLTSGRLRATGMKGSTMNWTRQFFDEVDDAPSLDGKWVMVLRTAGAQDMIAGDPPTDVPAPATLPLALAALGGLAATRRRRSDG